RRKLETHPKTGAAQLVEIRERVQEIIVPKYVEAAPISAPKPALFDHLSDSELLGYGVPSEWLSNVREANEETLLELADHLPKEAAEALLDLATGVTPQIALPIRVPLRVSAYVDITKTIQQGALPSQLEPAIVSRESFEHPDARRRFHLINNLEELERALDYPWEKWTVFLHPAQRELVEREYNGPARVSGSAGTGKTIVAVHRVVYLARKNPDSRLLLTTFSDPLSNALRTKLRHLIGTEPRLRERIEIHAMNSIGKQLYEANVEKPQFAGPEMI